MYPFQISGDIKLTVGLQKGTARLSVWTYNLWYDRESAVLTAGSIIGRVDTASRHNAAADRSEST